MAKAEMKRDWCGRTVGDAPIAYINRTGLDIGDFGHRCVMDAIANGGSLHEDVADLFTLSRSAGVWILECA